MSKQDAQAKVRDACRALAEAVVLLEEVGWNRECCELMKLRNSIAEKVNAWAESQQQQHE